MVCPTHALLSDLGPVRARRRAAISFRLAAAAQPSGRSQGPRRSVRDLPLPALVCGRYSNTGGKADQAQARLASILGVEQPGDDDGFGRFNTTWLA